MTERDLFRELIRHVDRKINPGLNRLTWNTEYVDAYIEDCFNQTANVRFVLSLLRFWLPSLSSSSSNLNRSERATPILCAAEIYATSPALS